MLDKLRDEIATLIAKAAGADKQNLLPTIEVSREGFGDLSSKAAFILAKEKKENPAR